MNKLDFILKFATFMVDSSNNIICTDENILGHYNISRETGKTKEECAEKIVKRYNHFIDSDAPQRRDLWELGWHADGFEPHFEKLKNIYLSLISNSNWINGQHILAPIGREYLFKEFVNQNYLYSYYQTHFPAKANLEPAEALREIRTLTDDSSFEFSNYTKQDCIREGFFQVYSQKSLDELKALLKSIQR